MECGWTPEGGKSKKKKKELVPGESRKECSSAKNLILAQWELSDFWLQNAKKINLHCFHPEFVIICYSSNTKHIQSSILFMRVERQESAGNLGGAVLIQPIILWLRTLKSSSHTIGNALLGTRIVLCFLPSIAGGSGSGTGHFPLYPT